MTLRRFVRRDGWERWVDMPDPPRRHFVLQFSPPPSGSYADHLLLSARGEPAPVAVVFNREAWRDQSVAVDDEPVYVEDGAPASLLRAVVGPDRPSLHRERALRGRYDDLVRAVSAVVESVEGMRSPIGQAVAAANAVDLLRAVLAEHAP